VAFNRSGWGCLNKAQGTRRRAKGEKIFGALLSFPSIGLLQKTGVKHEKTILGLVMYFCN